MTKPALEVSVEEFRKNVAEYIQHAWEGRSTTVTRYGYPVAQLTPLPKTP
jgi:antitoxin (DNA-binding transcriptional repressor) of toxin-antitoxin stability system